MTGVSIENPGKSFPLSENYEKCGRDCELGKLLRWTVYIFQRLENVETSSFREEGGDPP